MGLMRAQRPAICARGAERAHFGGGSGSMEGLWNTQKKPESRAQVEVGCARVQRKASDNCRRPIMVGENVFRSCERAERVVSDF